MSPAVADVYRVYDPGCHCAFTDIILWHNRVYLTFREALNHSINSSGQILVLGSADLGRSFTQHARIAEGGYDLRDPHFFVAGDRLGIVIPGWLIPNADNGLSSPRRTCHVALSGNGVDWELHKVEEPQGKTLWRPRTGPDGRLYAVGYAPAREEADYRTALYVSDDGIAWEQVSALHGENRANETDICFLPDGTLLALVRCEEPPKKPVLARSRPPYAGWEKTECNRFLQGPLLVRLPEGGLMVVGRSPEPLDGDGRTGGYLTRAFGLDPGTGELDYWFTLPSGGDTSYAGYVQLDEHEALLSYYSGHGYAHGSYRGGFASQRTAIYLARLQT